MSDPVSVHTCTKQLTQALQARVCVCERVFVCGPFRWCLQPLVREEDVSGGRVSSTAVGSRDVGAVGAVPWDMPLCQPHAATLHHGKQPNSATPSGEKESCWDILAPAAAAKYLCFLCCCLHKVWTFMRLETHNSRTHPASEYDVTLWGVESDKRVPDLKSCSSVAGKKTFVGNRSP